MLRLICSAVVLLASVSTSAAPPIAAYGQLPSLGQFSLSPDGTRFAAVVGSGDAAELQVRNLADGVMVMATPAGRFKLRAVQWAGPNYLILTVSQTRQMSSTDFQFAGRAEYLQLLRYDFAAKSWGRLMENIPLTGNTVYGPPVVIEADGKPQLVVSGFTIPDSTAVATVFRIDVATRVVRMMERGISDTNSWVIGPDGKVLARSDYNQKTGLWKTMANRNPGWAEVYLETAPVDSPTLLGVGRTPGTVRVQTHKSGYWRTHELALADGAWNAEAETSSSAVIVSPATRAPIGYVNSTMTGVDYQFIDPNDAKLWRGITRAFPGAQVDWEGWTSDRGKVAVNVYGGQFGNGLYVVDRVGKTAGLLSQRYAGIDPADIAKVEAITYRAADGLEISAFLTLPPGRAAKGLPLVVMPHGGPESHDELGFDWWAQAIASRGYAVLQPQFRGSSGFGSDHTAAGYGQWGRKMQSDVSDGVRDLVAKGVADPKRVCIVGASYGGYAAMAGVTVEQGVYRCASAVAGVSDLRRMLATEAQDSGGVRNETQRYWQRFMGASSASDTAVDLYSPALLAERVKVPLQLIHGMDDTVVRIEQSRIMAEAMKKAGKTAEYLELPSEDHYLSRPATRIAMLEAQVAFLEKHNPPDAAPAP